jgi:hypothetical protein
VKVKTVSPIQSARGVIPAGRIIEISAVMLEKLQGKVQPLDATQCKFWNQVCHAVGFYQEQCTATGDSLCRVYRFLELNTKDHQGAITTQPDLLAA